MHLSTASVLLTSLPLATAQTSTSNSQKPSHTGTITPSGCGPQIDGIIQTCLIDSNIILAACDKTDFSCLCSRAAAVADCYLNCPTAPGQEPLKDASNTYCAKAVDLPVATVTETSASVVTEVSVTTGSGGMKVNFGPVTKVDGVRVTSSSEAGARKAGAGVVSGGGVVGLVLGWVALL
ncbi:hypothetical protein B0A48_09038 [Cryoendolithus antarcticus]|uniref:Extracellular membrane protein CFEM domain-containing protein n=1 Tax=Cryoendolithus antarcticus TaxID=1507870 RepID=A0A1V8T1Y6_9PEZI|nr:hypothetical protein B0A48_09038 [Cryoendolithus antarcticus]